MKNIQKTRRPVAEGLLAAGMLLVLGCRPDRPPPAWTQWGPQGAVQEMQRRFHAIPAHVLAPCASCHVEPGARKFQAGPSQCGPCHGSPAAPPEHRDLPAGPTKAATSAPTSET